MWTEMPDIAQFSVSVPETLLERLDSHRKRLNDRDGGMIPRSRLVAKAIEEFLESREKREGEGP